MPQFLARLRVIGEPLEHVVEMPRLFAGRNRRPIQFRERLGKLAEAVGERMAFHDLGAHAEKNTLGARLVVLLRNGE